MYRALPFSLLLHAAIIGLSIVSLPFGEREVEVIEIVPIDIIEISDLTNVAPMIPRTSDDSLEDTPLPQRPEPNLEEYLDDLETLPEDMTAPEDVVPPLSEADKVAVSEEGSASEPEETAPIIRRDALDDILNDSPFQIPDEETLIDLADKDPRLGPEEITEDPPEEEAGASETLRKGAGERTANEARVKSLVEDSMKVCWVEIADLPNPETLTVSLLVELNRDGTLKGDVQLISPRKMPIGDIAMRQAITRAVRAAQKCEPYDLPLEDYEIWREIKVNFRHKK